MITGLKTIDNLLSTYGIRTEEGDDKSQLLITLTGGDIRASQLRLPFCMQQKIQHVAPSRRFKFHQFLLPHKHARLACFLIDESGQVIEQVYFQRDAKHVAASRKIQRLVEAAHCQKPSANRAMAA